MLLAEGRRARDSPAAAPRGPSHLFSPAEALVGRQPQASGHWESSLYGPGDDKATTRSPASMSRVIGKLAMLLTPIAA